MKFFKLKNALLAAAIFVGCAVFIWWQNNDVTVSACDYSSPRVGTAFDGFRIVQLSDLHNKTFGAGQKRLLAAVESLRPDAIFITGDLIDSNIEGTENARALVNGLLGLAPLYYVTGNHESRAGKYADLLVFLKQSGVTVLDGEKVVLEREGQSVELLGVGDLEFDKQYASDAEALARMEDKLRALCADGDAFRILLSHRPELIDLYAGFGIDLVFTGHAHGGQWRLPLVGGLYAPDQGLFPQYTAGAYVRGDTTEYVSRGLGNSIFPVRLFNRPEVVCVTLHTART
ncbi:MAG: metallophosphoesterase [Oscillospiraceae bacterium]|nr:metallophosphoesterase [Oscillospiraceae bacterium]